MANQIVHRAACFRGKPNIPGDKSISHRALILGALSEGRTEITNILTGGDVQSTARCLGDLGVSIIRSGASDGTTLTTVEGLGVKGFTSPVRVLDCGNSGTTIRTLMGVLAGGDITATLSGDASLVRRPMRRVAAPLLLMGARIELTADDYAPLTIQGSKLHGINYSLPVASAQLKTAVLLAGLLAEGVTRITGQIDSRDHTERMLRHFGAKLQESSSELSITGGQTLVANRVLVPGDPSATAFWLAAACLVPGAHLRLENISLNFTRIGFIRALQRMGANIVVELESEVPEPVGCIEARFSNLKGIRVTVSEIPALIDELPMLAVLASQAVGETVVEGAEELRVKESDRIEAVAVNLRAMGASIETRKDGFTLAGRQSLRGTDIRSFHDHRIAMAFSIAGLVAEGDTTIHDAECVGISYPEFFATLERLCRP
ncbi:MAG: 3-phosphoshikimate 1-carboxyvinyltransferase [Candidatus Riflebacteria bacterium]|nr:3-phosphoshikimate 1-carboxyvinyltransferase [Candidatus Riflebacteria bacterium]